MEYNLGDLPNGSDTFDSSNNIVSDGVDFGSPSLYLGSGSIITTPSDIGGGGAGVTPVDPAIYDTYSGDESDEPDDGNNSYNGPTEHIPSQITLNNGQVVQVEFGTTTSDNKNADNPVSVKLVNLLISALNIASQQTTIYKIYIAATTNGRHINNPPLHVSNHYSGLAIDLSRIMEFLWLF